MRLLNKPEDIWILKTTKKDLQTGANYAAKTLPWTFNRMMMNRGSSGQQSRALNIAKGIVAQEVLRRELERRNIKPVTQQKSHRDEDLFDLDMLVKGQVRKLDIKSVHYFTNYTELGREPLSRELVISNSQYPGPDWRRFFPMLIPHTQVLQEKETYCFIIASSIDPRKDTSMSRSGFAITAFPYGESEAFLASKKLCLAREQVNKGILVNCSYRTAEMFDAKKITLQVNGEWGGKLKTEHVPLVSNSKGCEVGPFSCVASFQLGNEDFEQFHGQIEVTVSRNDFDEAVLNTQRRDVNELPEDSLVFERNDFCNLILPDDFEMYVVGWISKADFLKATRKYTGWVWPNDKINRFENQPWNWITEKDNERFTKLGFGDSIQGKPSLVKAGFMKTTGRGGGACCYVFPNIGHGGGVKETNLYVLPSDLRSMDDLPDALST